MKVSICIPVYNGEKYLLECLDSVEKQTFRDFELVVSDDKSTDASMTIVRDFLIDNPKIKYKVITNRRRGISNNWNNCLKHCDGEYVKFLFQDDYLEPSCLDTMVKVLDENPSIGLVGCKRKVHLDSNNPDFVNEWLNRFLDLQLSLNKIDNSILIDKTLFKSDLFFLDPINKIGEPSVVMFRKNIVSKIGYFSEKLFQTLDFEYWFRILKKSQILIIEEPLAYFRLHDNQASFVNRSKFELEYLVLNKMFIKKYFWDFSFKNKIEVLNRQYLFVRRILALKNKIFDFFLNNK